MMDYYSEQQGPTKQEAKNQLEASLKPKLLEETKVKGKPIPSRFLDEVNRMIDESINEGVEKAYKEYSLTGWAMFGMKDCEAAIRRIYKDKLTEFKAKMKKETHKELALGRNLEGAQRHVASFLGGRRKKHRKKGKYSLKKRKSIRKKKRATRKL